VRESLPFILYASNTSSRALASGITPRKFHLAGRSLGSSSTPPSAPSKITSRASVFTSAAIEQESISNTVHSAVPTAPSPPLHSFHFRLKKIAIVPAHSKVTGIVRDSI